MADYVALTEVQDKSYSFCDDLKDFCKKTKTSTLYRARDIGKRILIATLPCEGDWKQDYITLTRGADLLALQYVEDWRMRTVAPELWSKALDSIDNVGIKTMPPTLAADLENISDAFHAGMHEDKKPKQTNEILKKIATVYAPEWDTKWVHKWGRMPESTKESIDTWLKEHPKMPSNVRATIVKMCTY
jgi:hypothetical protein